MEFGISQLRHLAALSELSLTEAEETELVVEVSRIIQYIAELDAVDTTDVLPTAHAMGAPPLGSGDGWRLDATAVGLEHDQALAAAPEAVQGGFAVPTFVE